MHLKGSLLLWALLNTNTNKNEFLVGGRSPAIHPAVFRNYRQKEIGITSDFFPWYQAEQNVLNKAWSSVFRLGFFFTLLKSVAKDFLSDSNFIDTWPTASLSYLPFLWFPLMNLILLDKHWMCNILSIPRGKKWKIPLHHELFKHLIDSATTIYSSV